MLHALLAIQNILQNSNTFVGSRETVLFTPFGDKKVTQFSGLPPTSVSYLKDVRGWQFLTIEAAETLCMVCLPPKEHIFRKNIWVTNLSKSHTL